MVFKSDHETVKEGRVKIANSFSKDKETDWQQTGQESIFSDTRESWSKWNIVKVLPDLLSFSQLFTLLNAYEAVRSIKENYLSFESKWNVAEKNFQLIFSACA